MKKFVKIGFVAVFAAIAGYGVYANQKTELLSDLALANVEALAGDEASVTGCQPNGGTCVISIGSTHIVKDNQHP